ncbi:hypothetical protein BDSB_28900 [Burkholderia dolosa PC543]|nr:hypothetical protein BDSB_28900 [Burkholderia dolosa PC543]
MFRVMLDRVRRSGDCQQVAATQYRFDVDGNARPVARQAYDKQTARDFRRHERIQIQQRESVQITSHHHVGALRRQHAERVFAVDLVSNAR